MLFWFVMNQTGLNEWKVLCWNVHDLNSEARQLAVRQKIDESGCSIVCLQETKCMHIDQRFIRKFCPRHFDNFVYVPSADCWSVGGGGGGRPGAIYSWRETGGSAKYGE